MNGTSPSFFEHLRGLSKEHGQSKCLLQMIRKYWTAPNNDTQLTHDEQGGRHVELHPRDTFFKMSDEPVARSDNGVDLRQGAVSGSILSQVVKI